ncbi:MAG: hypothetical protein ACYCO3_05575 [Mycobacteriales bacterium]
MGGQQTLGASEVSIGEPGDLLGQRAQLGTWAVGVGLGAEQGCLLAEAGQGCGLTGGLPVLPCGVTAQRWPEPDIDRTNHGQQIVEQEVIQLLEAGPTLAAAAAAGEHAEPGPQAAQRASQDLAGLPRGRSSAGLECGGRRAGLLRGRSSAGLECGGRRAGLLRGRSSEEEGIDRHSLPRFPIFL